MTFPYNYVAPPKGHPLERLDGLNVAEHRIVLYDKVGPGVHPCHWCERPVAWWPVKGQQKLVTDHLDDDGLNNASENVVASCTRCNAARARWPQWLAQYVAAGRQEAS